MAELPPGWTLYDVTSSTNDTLHEAAADGAREGTLHLARTQTGGRGRAGRTWWSPPDSALLMSVLVRPRLPVERITGLALLVGKAVKDALEPISESSPQLYWPNDLYADRVRKIGGILCEMRSRGGGDGAGHDAGEDDGRGYWVAVGIGINIDLRRADIPEELRDRVADLSDLGCSETDPVGLARRITTAFWPLYERFQRGEGIAPLTGSALAHAGRRVTVHDSGGPPFRGVIEGLGERGELLVRDSRGALHAIIAGDVIYE